MRSISDFCCIKSPFIHYIQLFFFSPLIQLIIYSIHFSLVLDKNRFSSIHRECSLKSPNDGTGCAVWENYSVWILKTSKILAFHVSSFNKGWKNKGEKLRWGKLKIDFKTKTENYTTRLVPPNFLIEMTRLANLF